MRKLIGFVLLLIFTNAIFANQTMEIQRDDSVVRSGPGIYFEKVTEFKSGDQVKVIEQDEIWWKLETPEGSYISRKAFRKTKMNNDIFRQMAGTTTDLEASKHGLSAGIKGFAAKFTQSKGSYKEFQKLLKSNKIDRRIYKSIRKVKKRVTIQNFGNIKLPAGSRDEFTKEEILVGSAFGSSISALGLYQNPEVSSFINAYGNFLVQSTEMYDQRFYFFVLDSDKVNAYACPGGIVFLTKGLLQATENEAELAFVICHELAHTIKQHGLQELDERKNLIKADNAFAEMEDELDMMGVVQDEEMKKVEEELEHELFSFYENVFNGRLEKYEFEADEVGLLYLMRSGYSAHNAIKILSRLASTNTVSTNEHYTNNQLKDRLGNLRHYSAKFSLGENITITDWMEIKRRIR